MENQHLIRATLFCEHHSVELEFVSSLNEYGLIQIHRVDEDDFIDETELEKLERLARLHYDLDVNVEGIDVITHMLDRMREMQNEIRILREKLQFYEHEQ